MDIHLYNTLTRKKEIFVPLKKGRVSMYHCGPTVYDTPHIGNYRTFVLNDLIRRVFEYNDYEVRQVMNVTDVDDKTIKKAHEEKIPLKDVTLRYEKLFLLGLQSLNIGLPQDLTRATEYIPQMIALTETLLKNGTAYKADDGIYLDISKVKHYGKLANLKLDSDTKARVANDEYDKENARDFALWKFKSADDGDVSWPASFGEGRPGWHIECSAMAMAKLGNTIDIHTGGQDLLFPHHTNEIAQSESATGKPFVKYWLHGAFMNVTDEKMAKSKGNFIKLETLVDEGLSPLAFRYWLMTAHYRSPVNFTKPALEAAQNTLIRLMSTVATYPDGGTISTDYKSKFVSFINDDLNLPQAVALIWELLKDEKISPADKRATSLDFDKVLGLKLASAPRATDTPEIIPPEIQALSDAREEARKKKDWKKADALRAEIEARGFDVHDSNDGVKIISK